MQVTSCDEAQLSIDGARRKLDKFEVTWLAPTARSYYASAIGTAAAELRDRVARHHVTTTDGLVAPLTFTLQCQAWPHHISHVVASPSGLSILQL